MEKIRGAFSGGRQRRLQEKRVRSAHKESRRKPGMD
jgi:hypothetical protein